MPLQVRDEKHETIDAAKFSPEGGTVSVEVPGQLMAQPEAEEHKSTSQGAAQAPCQCATDSPIHRQCATQATSYPATLQPVAADTTPSQGSAKLE